MPPDQWNRNESGRKRLGFASHRRSRVNTMRSPSRLVERNWTGSEGSTRKMSEKAVGSSVVSTRTCPGVLRPTDLRSLSIGTGQRVPQVST